MAHKPAKPKQDDGVRDEFVTLALNPASGVDVLGDAMPPLLWAGVERDFTRAEADALLLLTNRHGTPICRIVQGE